MPPPQGTPNPLEGPGDYTVTKTVHSDTYPAIDPTAHPKEKLAGRAVFVSGASRGIGKAIAVSFARAGASKIAITGRGDLSAVADEVKAAARAAGRGEPAVLCVELEVSSQASVEAAAALVGREFGRCDVVVSNAGVFGTPSRIGEVADADAWWRVYEVNVRGQFLTARSFVPLLAGTPGGLGTFITVASVGAHLVSPGSSQYHPGKTMNLRFAEHIDAEYAAEGVSAWCVHPGNVLTDMAGGPDGEVAKGPMGAIFVDTPEICADTLSFLAADKRQWLSGRYINCTWDMPELLAQEDEIVKGDKLKIKLVL